MREIEFRGLDTENKMWHGSLHKVSNDVSSLYYIIQEEGLHLVKTSTIGQFTGVFDKNGNKIFEGDIIADEHGNKHTVFFTNGTFAAQYNNAILYLGQMYDHAKYLPYGINIDDNIDVTVIGNIHQNQELLVQ